MAALLAPSVALATDPAPSTSGVRRNLCRTITETFCARCSPGRSDSIDCTCPNTTAGFACGVIQKACETASCAAAIVATAKTLPASTTGVGAAVSVLSSVATTLVCKKAVESAMATWEACTCREDPKRCSDGEIWIYDPATGKCGCHCHQSACSLLCNTRMGGCVAGGECVDPTTGAVRRDNRGQPIMVTRDTECRCLPAPATECSYRRPWARDAEKALHGCVPRGDILGLENPQPVFDEAYADGQRCYPHWFTRCDGDARNCWHHETCTCRHLSEFGEALHDYTDNLRTDGDHTYGANLLPDSALITDACALGCQPDCLDPPGRADELRCKDGDVYRCVPPPVIQIGGPPQGIWELADVCCGGDCHEAADPIASRLEAVCSFRDAPSCEDPPTCSGETTCRDDTVQRCDRGEWVPVGDEGTQCCYREGDDVPYPCGPCALDTDRDGRRETTLDVGECLCTGPSQFQICDRAGANQTFKDFLATYDCAGDSGCGDDGCCCEPADPSVGAPPRWGPSSDHASQWPGVSQSDCEAACCDPGWCEPMNDRGTVVDPRGAIDHWICVGCDAGTIGRRYTVEDCAGRCCDAQVCAPVPGQENRWHCTEDCGLGSGDACCPDESDPCPQSEHLRCCRGWFGHQPGEAPPDAPLACNTCYGDGSAMQYASEAEAACKCCSGESHRDDDGLRYCGPAPPPPCGSLGAECCDDGAACRADGTRCCDWGTRRHEEPTCQECLPNGYSLYWDPDARLRLHTRDEKRCRCCAGEFSSSGAYEACGPASCNPYEFNTCCRDSPDDCQDGCCTGDRCSAGWDDDACGTGGGRCSDCAAHGGKCTDDRVCEYPCGGVGEACCDIPGVDPCDAGDGDRLRCCPVGGEAGPLCLTCTEDGWPSADAVACECCSGLNHAVGEGYVCGVAPACSDDADCGGDACTEASCDFEAGRCAYAARDCDDGEACTDDRCDPRAGCEHHPVEGPCDDGDPCTVSSFCAGGSCQLGLGELVQDADAVFDEWRGLLAAAITDPRLSVGGLRAEGPPATPIFQRPASPLGGLPADWRLTVACDDGDPCTVDGCEPVGGCLNLAQRCDDGDPCTVDACGEDGCTHTLTDAPCEDGDPCTGPDACGADGCTGPPICACREDRDCDDGAACTDDRCVEGVCHALAADGPCDDGDPCTTDDHCADGACTGLPVDCDDGDACNGAESCDADTGSCESGTPVLCDDGDACNGYEWCWDDACQPGEPVDCDDGDACNGTEACDPATGGCAPGDAMDCEDGDYCNGYESCWEGVCQPGEPIDCDDGDACNGVESCETATGSCLAGDPMQCEDGDYCNGYEWCWDNTCQPGEPIGCDDDDPCNGVESCDEAIDGCASGAPLRCDDGDECNGVEWCWDGICHAGEPYDCDDGNPCNGAERCDPAAGGCVSERPNDCSIPCGDFDCDGFDNCDGSPSGCAPTDAGGSPTDAGGSPSDAGGSPTDAGGSPSDAGGSLSDAGGSLSDAGEHPPDAISPPTDTGACEGTDPGAASDPGAVRDPGTE